MSHMSRIVTAVPALLTGASLLVLCAHTPASAQQIATAAGSSDGGLEEIVVTARRKEEKAQSVPIAITAFSQADIEQKRILQASDLIKNVPSLSGEQLGSDPNALYATQIRLRGLPGTVVYFADVPLGSTDYNATTGVTHSLTGGLYYDLDNLEILKGPQGTLFGKNSIGGLISLEPKKPTNEFEGYIEARFGNYGDREFEGAINIPIIQDKLLVRIAGQSQQRDGYTKDVSNGEYYDNKNNYGWRVGVTFRPTDDFENYLLYDGYWQDTNGSTGILSYINPGFTLGQIPIPGVNPIPGHPGQFAPVPLTLGNGPALSALENPATAAATYGQLLAANAAGRTAMLSFFPNLRTVFAQQQALGPRAVAGLAAPNIGKDYFYGITDTATWDINDDLTVKNIAAARVFKQLTTNDEAGVALPILVLGNPAGNHGWTDNSVQYTEEFQLQGKALQEKLNWVLGGFLEFDHPLGKTDYPGSTLGTVSYYHFHDSSRSQALFAHGIYDLDDYVSGLRFTAGYRYTWDFLSVQENGYNGVDRVSRGVGGVPTNCAPIVFDTNCASGGNANYSSYGWNVGLDEQLTPDTLLYVRSGNAYRPGAINPQVPAAYQAVKPEHVTDVEIGAKTDWTLFGAHFRTNADIYHTDYKAIQVLQIVQVKDSQGNAHAQGLETNAASATLEGAELEVNAVPIPGLEISPRASYIYSHYDKYPLVFGVTQSPTFAYEAKWQVGVTASYTLPVDESLGDISLSANYSFTGHQYVIPSGGDIFPIIPSYDNLDVRVDWKNFLLAPVDLGFFMTNALDSTHIQGVSPLYYQLGFTSLIYNEPRMFGFSVKYRFGGATQPEAPAAVYTPPPAVAAAPSVPKSYLVFFDFNKSDLTPQASEIVDTAAKNASVAKVTQLTVTGHTDTVGSDAYNMRLSRRRAESVAAQLEKDGIPSSEIEIVAKGKRDLLVPTADGVKEPQNRRVQIVYSNEAGA